MGFGQHHTLITAEYKMRNSRVIAAYNRHTCQHMVLKEEKKNYTSFKSVVDVLVVFPLLQDVEILCRV